MLRIVWGSLMTGEGGGYGRVGMRLAASIKEFVDDIELADRFSLDYDWRIIVAVPYNWVIGAMPQPDLIWHTMVECQPMPQALLPLYEQAEHIWVPSNFVKNVLVDGGVKTPIFVSGYGMDSKQFPFIDRERENMPGRRGDRPYRFLGWTDNITTRKGVIDVMRTFHKLNLPDCELIIKMSADAVPMEARENQNIHFVQGNLQWFELVQLIGQCDTMVYPSRGEGFGLMPLEAMATGMCVMAPNSSGMADFVREDCNIIIPSVGMERVITSSAAYETDQFGFAPDLDMIAEQMCWCYNNQHEAYEIGKRASEYVHREWTWELAAHRAAEQLRALGSWKDIW